MSVLAGDDGPLDEVDEILDSSGTSSTEPDSDDPLTTLRARYARGELTDAQFERKLETPLETETLEASEERATRRLRDGAFEVGAGTDTESEAADEQTN